MPIQQAGLAGRTYVYTADDERLATYVNGGAQSSTWTVRGLDGKVLRAVSEDGAGNWTWEKDYVYREGSLLASESSDHGTWNYHLDHLGTVRMITAAVPGVDAIVSRHDYYAFGEEAMPTYDGETLRFTGHERDEVSYPPEPGAFDLDYMHARYCSPVTGRFLSVDPVPRIDVAAHAPQLWNLYAYAANNPLKFTDPDGLFIQLPEACIKDDQCAELGFLRQTLIEAQARDVANQLTVGKNGRVKLSRNLRKSSNSTVRKLATAANETRTGFRLSATTGGLGASGGAETTFNRRENIFEIRIDPAELGNTMFLLENTSTGASSFGFLSGGEAVMHEVGHFFAGSGLMSSASNLASRENANNALMYENLHRQTRGGSRASLVRNKHDAMRKADEN